MRLASTSKRCSRTFSQPLREYGRPVDGGFRKNHHELLSAIPCHDVYGPDACRKKRRDVSEDGIADQVSMLIVDRLEVVEIQHEHGNLVLEPPRAIDLRAEPVEER